MQVTALVWINALHFAPNLWKRAGLPLPVITSSSQFGTNMPSPIDFRVAED